ncbi:hypothetical protein SELMODRAFT_405197 [Selaginella moellendorffii]|uniref:Leucine-rich repeat-containing N-terminal plant-type domain-containing protein n=1 Tax=Selaginella moellendorffii TaxID=88036 RepID=D8QWJ7_SELML|nr:hypothetical protein SELMODRAFT_405197 [Selaginella moellendorffii]
MAPVERRELAKLWWDSPSDVVGAEAQHCDEVISSWIIGILENQLGMPQWCHEQGVKRVEPNLLLDQRKAVLEDEEEEEEEEGVETQQSSSCAWPGVKCDGASGRVSELKLESMGLRGTLSPELGSLSQLWTLSVHDNGTDGPVPPAFG